MISLYSSLTQMQILVGIAAAIQAAEFIYLRKYFSKNGVWPIPQFDAVNAARLVCAFFAIVTPAPVWIWLLFFAHAYTWHHLRGSFNGGSDYMFMILSLCLATALSLHHKEELQNAIMYYIAIQLVLSYFLAGAYKLKSTKWRSGSALSEIVASPVYVPLPKYFRFIASYGLTSRLTAWSILVFEILFPFSLLSFEFTAFFLCVAFLFHLANAYVFGLNRFLFTWIAAYPALLYTSAKLNLLS